MADEPPRGEPAFERVRLVVMDGWGIAAAGPGNAIASARTPVFDELWSSYPHAALSASGRDVGLPDGQMGNSEVGHLTLGAGAVVPQTLTVINDSAAAGELAGNEVVRAALSAGERVHLLGMVSDGGVHSGFEHLHALIELAGRVQVPDLVLHCITDGRDTSPTAGEGYLRTVEQWCGGAGTGRVASVIGRYYAMDRDRRFRPDRMREIVRALAEPGFVDGLEELPGWRGRNGGAPVRRLATMTEYQRGFPYPVAFRSARALDTLGAAVARSGATQLHVAETEKYAHVTYFFNGGEEQPLPGETRKLVPSQRDVATYDLKPEMSGREVAAAFEQTFAVERPRFSVINFANADMVGHTGVIPATITAVETVDDCLGRVVSAVQR